MIFFFIDTNLIKPQYIKSVILEINPALTQQLRNRCKHGFVWKTPFDNDLALTAH